MIVLKKYKVKFDAKRHLPLEEVPSNPFKKSGFLVQAPDFCNQSNYLAAWVSRSKIEMKQADTC